MSEDVSYQLSAISSQPSAVSKQDRHQSGSRLLLLMAESGRR